MRPIGFFVLLFCLLLTSGLRAQTVSPQNPLARAQNVTPPTQAVDFQGQFSGEGISLKLYQQGGDYQGQLTYQGQTYPLKASIDGKALRGFFYQQTHAFAFSAHLLGRQLNLQSGEAHFLLTATSQEETPAPPVAASAPPANAEKFPVPAALQANVAPPLPPPLPALPEGNLQAQFQTLAIQTGSEFRLFMGTLERWLARRLSNVQAAVLTEQFLLPQTYVLQQRLAHLSTLAAQLGNQPAIRAEDAAVLRRLARISEQGAGLFQQWHSLLGNMQQAVKQERHAELQQLATAQLPQLIQATSHYVKPLSLLVRAGRTLKAPASSAQRPQIPSANPSRLLKWQTLHNMSEMMREGMTMLKDIGQ